MTGAGVVAFSPGWALLAMMVMLAGRGAASAEPAKTLVRLSEIQIHPGHLESYKSILKEEAEASVRLEPGVIAIFPMHQKENPTEIRILEIYASHAAYESHLKTPHFLRYKSTTLEMVRSLKLVDMEAMDTATMSAIFAKMTIGPEDRR